MARTPAQNSAITLVLIATGIAVLVWELTPVLTGEGPVVVQDEPAAPKLAIRRVDGLIAQDYAFAAKPGEEKLVQVMVGADVDREGAVSVDHCVAELQTGASQIYRQMPDPRAAALPANARSFGPYWFFIDRGDYSKDAQLRLRCDGLVTDWAPFKMANLLEKPVAP